MSIRLIAQTINEALNQNKTCVAATIISRQGSTPRTAGTKMLIYPDGDFVGTIGGGRVEAEVIEKARRLPDEGRSVFMAFDLTSRDAAGMDLICGGTLEVFLDLIRPGQVSAPVFQAWQAELDAGRTAYLVTILNRDDGLASQVDHCLVNAADELIGDPPCSRAAIAAAVEEAAGGSVLSVQSRENMLLLVEPTARVKTVYLIGAGHVSKPTAHFAAQTGFRVVAMDDRPEFANPSRFPEAEVRLIDDYDHFMENLPIDEDAFVVILTRGHLHDREVLTQALKTRAGYIGMIGSRSKRNAIYEALAEEGFTNDDLGRVFSPVGLKIGGETPEEIAISIVAEMIQVRAELKKS